MYICVKLSYFAIQQRLTEHPKSNTLQYKVFLKKLKSGSNLEINT